MKEKLLQHLGKSIIITGIFNDRWLNVRVIHPGQYNSHQGPDFLQGKCRIDETTFVGHIELHIRASDWNRHLHQFDPNYENVILHVVLQTTNPQILSDFQR